MWPRRGILFKCYFQSLMAGKDPQTHRLFFSKHFQNQDGLETKETDEAD